MTHLHEFKICQITESPFRDFLKPVVANCSKKKKIEKKTQDSGGTLELFIY